MPIGDFAGEYQAKTDEELLRLAMDSDQLTSEAQAYLTSEFAQRGISAEQVRAFRERPEPIVSSPILPGRDPYTIGPPLPSETSKAPWRPKIAGRIAFFFGPVAGALVVVISLRRMGYPQKRQESPASRTRHGGGRGCNYLLHSRRAVKTCKFWCGDWVPVDFPCFHGERVQRMASHSPGCHAVQRLEGDWVGRGRNCRACCDFLPHVHSAIKTPSRRSLTL